MAAMLYETLLLFGVLSVFFLLPQTLLGMYRGATSSGWLLALHLFIVLGIYFVGLWRKTGQTLAMKTWKLRIRMPNGGPPSLARLTVRYLLAWPSVMYFGAGLLWAFLDRDRQFLHDRLAGTRIISTE
jgi:uncharacterized RDD family membrane protein YckC